MLMIQRNYGQVAQSVERSPEKAGVGGSIPSLATTFSNTYRPSTPGFGSNWFQFQPADTVSKVVSVRQSITDCNSLIPSSALISLSMKLFQMPS
jgi:hypothetical protein